MLARFDDAGEGLVVSEDLEVYRPEVAAKALQGPNNPPASRSKVVQLRSAGMVARLM